MQYHITAFILQYVYSCTTLYEGTFVHVHVHVHVHVQYTYTYTYKILILWKYFKNLLPEVLFPEIHVQYMYCM